MLLSVGHETAGASSDPAAVKAGGNSPTVQPMSVAAVTGVPVPKKRRYNPYAPDDQVPGVEHLRYPFMAILMAIFVTPIFYYIAVAKKGRDLFLRKLPGVAAIDEAIGRAVEMGRPIFFTTGLTRVDPILFACLGVIAHVARKAATYGARLFVPQTNPEVMAICQETVHQAYRATGREEAYEPNCIRYIAPQQFAFASGYMGMVHREKAAACFMFGTYAAEALVLAEAGQQVGAIQVAATVSNEQVPFFITTCDYTIIGEELFAVSAYLTREPVLLGSLRGQDFAKIVIFVMIIIGVIWATFQGATQYDVGFAKLIIPGPEGGN